MQQRSSHFGMNAVFVCPHPQPLSLWEKGEWRKMNTQNISIEIQDTQLQERVAVVIEDNARPAEQILTEQASEHEVNSNTSAHRYLP